MQPKISIPKSIIAILVPILEIFSSPLIKLAPTQTGKVIITDLVFAVGFLILIFMYRKWLKASWQEFRPHIWRNLGISVLLTICLMIVLSVIRIFMPNSGSTGPLSLATVQAVD